MALNIFSSFNDPKKDITNPLLLQYADKIDVNGDGEFSDDELTAFEEENPEIYASIFSDGSSASTQTLPQEGESIYDDKLSENDIDESKNVFIDITDLDGIDLESFTQLGASEDNDELTSKFWNVLSEFDLGKLFNFINTDKDDVLSKEELTNLSSIDGIEDNLSLLDLKEFIDNEKAEIQQEEPNEEEVNPEEENPVEEQTPTAPQNSSGGGSVPSNYGGNNSGVGTVNAADTVKPEKDVKTQYSDNLSSAKTEFSSAKSKYEDVLDGNIKDADLQDKKEDMDNAYASWQEELSKQNPQLAENIDKAKSDVESVQQEISQNEKDIYDNEINLSDCETAYDSAKTYREGLESKKSELESAVSGLSSSNAADAKKIEAYNNQISIIESEIASAKREEDAAKDKKDDAKDALDDSKDKKSALEDKLKEKEDILSSYMEEAEQLSKDNPELMKLQQTYEDKKDIYEKALSDYKDKLKAEADSKHDDVIKNQKLLTDYENNEKLEAYNNPIFDYDADLADIFNKYLLQGAGSSSKNDCGGAVRRALCKALEERYGSNVAQLFAKGFGVIGGDWDDQYLAGCPFFTDITDMYSTSEFEQMIQNGELQGAIINYEKYPGGSSGHVEGVTTQGLTSDFTRKYTAFRSNSAIGQSKYHVFIPRSASEQELNEYIQLMQGRMKTYQSPI